MMLPHVASSTSDSLKLQLRVEMGIFLVGRFIPLRCLGEKSGLLAQRRMADHAQTRLVRAGLGEIDNLSPGSWPHRPAVEALLPVRILPRMAAAAGLGPERGLFFRVVGWRGALEGNRPPPIFVEKSLCLLVKRNNGSGFLSLLARRKKKPGNKKKQDKKP